MYVVFLASALVQARVPVNLFRIVSRTESRGTNQYVDR